MCAMRSVARAFLILKGVPRRDRVEHGLPFCLVSLGPVLTQTRGSMQRRTTSLIALFAVPIAGMLILGVAAARVPGPESSELSLRAELSTRTLTITRDGEVVKTYPIAVGAQRHPTPTGSYMMRKMTWNPGWIPPDSRWARGKRPTDPGDPANPMRTVKIFFREPAYYIHGTNAVGSLGEAASHGCIRMDPEDAAEVGLIVMENGGTARDWDWVKSILGLSEAHTVTMQRAAPLTIVP
jgi:murein L,D-transpeptidase YcbB/YkuD